MKFCSGTQGQETEIIGLFVATFTESENAEEGRLVGALAKDLVNQTPADDRLVFTAWRKQELVGAIIFSKMRYDHDDRLVFILSPVAVKTDHQGHGVGRKLLKHGLEALRDQGVDVVITYGDPDYYGKVGFRQISQTFAPPPLKLTYPHGWLAQPLSDRPFSPLLGKAHCVDALNNSKLW